jgi:signal transduction histidine kinase
MELYKMQEELQIQILEHQKLDEALRKANNRISNILNSITDIFFALDENWQIIYLNSGAETFLKNINREEKNLIGINICKTFPELIDKMVYEYLNKTMKEQMAVEFERFYTFLDMWFEIHIYPSQDGLSIYMRDITDHKNMEERIRQNTARTKVLERISHLFAKVTLDYQAVLDTAVKQIGNLIGDVCIIRLLSDDEKWLNPVAIYHRNPEVLSFMRELLASAPQRSDEGLGGIVVQTNQSLFIPIISQEQIRASTKPEYWPYLERFGIHSVIIVPLCARGKVIGILGVSRDNPGYPYTKDDQSFLQAIADRSALAIANAKLFEEVQKELNERKRIQEELEDTLKKLRDTEAQLIQSEKMASLGQFIAGVAHEINNPSTFITVNIPFLSDFFSINTKIIDRYKEFVSSLPNEYENYKVEMEKLKEESMYYFMCEKFEKVVSAIEYGSKRIIKIIEDLRTFAEPEKTKSKYINLNDSIEIVLNLISDKYKIETQIFRNYGAIPEIKCFHSQINQVLMHVILNAFQSIEGKGNIWIKTDMVISDEKLVMRNKEGGMRNSKFYTPNSTFVRISIKDDGVGIPEEIKNKVFDPFFTTKPVNQSHGLGLSISYSIVKKHKGKIYFESPPKNALKGTEFFIELPVEISEED